jgi:hypothetical protein
MGQYLPGDIEVVATIQCIGRFANRDVDLGFRTEAQINELLRKGKGEFENGKFIVRMSSTLVDEANQRDVHDEKNAVLDRMEAMRDFTAPREREVNETPEQDAADLDAFTAEIVAEFGAPPAKPDSLDGVVWDEFGDPEKLEILKTAFGEKCFSDGLPTYQTPAPMPPAYRQMLDEQNKDAVVVLDWSKKGIAASRAQRGLRHQAQQPAPKLLTENIPAMDLDFGRRDEVKVEILARGEVVDVTPLQELPREE